MALFLSSQIGVSKLDDFACDQVPIIFRHVYDFPNEARWWV